MIAQLSANLPNEIDLFFSVDREWRALMVQIRRNPAIIPACSKTGLFHALRIMRKV
jgi:hypothetical protein